MRSKVCKRALRPRPATTQETTARDTAMPAAAGLDPSDDTATAALLEGKVALVRGRIEAFEAQIAKA